MKFNKKIYCFSVFFLFFVSACMAMELKKVENLNTIEKSKDALKRKIIGINSLIYLSYVRSDIDKKESIDKAIEAIKEDFSDSEEESLLFLKKIFISLDNDCIDYVFDYYDKHKIKDFLKKSCYLDLIKKKNLTDTSIYGKMYKAREENLFDFSFYSQIIPLFIEEREEIEKKSLSIENRFLAKTRLELFFKENKNKNNTFYRKSLMLLMSEYPNIEDEKIILFLELEDKNKLLPLTEKDGTDFSRIFYAGKKNKDVLIQFSFYPGDGFIKKQFKDDDSDFNSTFYNINQINSKCYSLIAITTDKNEYPVEIECIFVNKKQINCIENFIIYGSKSYWESEQMEEINIEQKNNSYSENKILEDQLFCDKKELFENKSGEIQSFQYRPFKTEDKKIIFPSFLLLTDDPEFTLNLPLLEKNKKKYPYDSILLQPTPLSTVSSIKLDNGAIIHITHKSICHKERKSKIDYIDYVDYLNISLGSKTTMPFNKKPLLEKNFLHII